MTDDAETSAGAKEPHKDTTRQARASISSPRLRITYSVLSTPFRSLGEVKRWVSPATRRTGDVVLTEMLACAVPTQYRASAFFPRASATFASLRRYFERNFPYARPRVDPTRLGSRRRPAGPLPEMTLEAGMTCVVQPNVITPDQKAGVQVGELVLVTETGFERMHRAERGLFRIG